MQIILLAIQSESRLDIPKKVITPRCNYRRNLADEKQNNTPPPLCSNRHNSVARY